MDGRVLLFAEMFTYLQIEKKITERTFLALPAIAGY